MELNLKVTMSLLLLVQAFHFTSSYYSTDSPGRTIDVSWQRKPAKETAGSQNFAIPTEEKGDDQRADATPLESSSDYGIASGSMAEFTQEEENGTGQDKDATEKDDNTTAGPTTTTTMSPNNVTDEADLSNVTTTATADPTTSSQTNMTEAEEEFNTTTTTPPQNFTSHPTEQNATSSPDSYNLTTVETTTLAQDGNTSWDITTRHHKKKHTVKTTVMANTDETSTTVSSTTVSLPETTQTSIATTTTTALNTSEEANRTDGAPASGGNSDRGLGSDASRSRRSGAWGAVLGTAVAVAFVGLVAYVILKRKHRKGFSHRKLVEDFTPDPVLRLDNDGPLDLNIGGSAYYNPAIQADNIQMSDLPGQN